jgi:hypothetical protein
MYGRADGMPSSQLTVAVCAKFSKFDEYESAAQAPTSADAICPKLEEIKLRQVYIVD